MWVKVRVRGRVKVSYPGCSKEAAIMKLVQKIFIDVKEQNGCKKAAQQHPLRKSRGENEKHI